MYLKRTILLIVLLLGIVGSAVLAGNSHTITVTIPEVCRYRIEDVTVIKSDSKETVEQVTVAVLSNSPRTWKLQATPGSQTQVVEWSADGLKWETLSSQPKTILHGFKTFWNNYRFYYKYRTMVEQSLNINYQVILSE